MGKKKSSTAAAVRPIRRATITPIRPGIEVPAQARTFTAAQLTLFKEQYLSTYLPVLRNHLLDEPDPRESFDWQALLCMVKTARDASRGRRAPRGV